PGPTSERRRPNAPTRGRTHGPARSPTGAGFRRIQRPLPGEEFRMASSQRRAVITGIGVVSPFGIGWPAFRHGLREGQSATRRPASFDGSRLACQVVGEVPDFDAARYVTPGEARRTPRVAPMAVLAAREA